MLNRRSNRNPVVASLAVQDDEEVAYFRVEQVLEPAQRPDMYPVRFNLSHPAGTPALADEDEDWSLTVTLADGREVEVERVPGEDVAWRTSRAYSVMQIIGMKAHLHSEYWTS